MTELEQSAFFADLEAALAALEDAASPNCPRLLEELEEIGNPALCDEGRPSFVADGQASDVRNPLENKVSGGRAAAQRQYAETHASQLISDTSATIVPGDQSASRARRKSKRDHRDRPAWKIAADRSGRRPRRNAAQVDVIATRKTWEGLKSRKRKDKLNPAEKFSAAVWAVAASGGKAVSLNLGTARESMLRCHQHPRRRMTQTLSKHLSAAGLGQIPYAFVFELTPKKDGGRLHLHGAIDTSGLTTTQTKLLENALIKAASEATGAIGGKRQLDLAPLYNPAGWADYLLDDTPTTKRELRLDNPFMVSKSMSRRARTYFELIRSAALKCVVYHELASSEVAAHKPTQIGRRGFPLRPQCGSMIPSGERDAKSAGGEKWKAQHRPHHRRTRVQGSRQTTGRPSVKLIAARSSASFVPRHKGRETAAERGRSPVYGPRV